MGSQQRDPHGHPVRFIRRLRPSGLQSPCLSSEGAQGLYVHLLGESLRTGTHSGHGRSGVGLVLLRDFRQTLPVIWPAGLVQHPPEGHLRPVGGYLLLTAGLAVGLDEVLHRDAVCVVSFLSLHAMLRFQNWATVLPVSIMTLFLSAFPHNSSSSVSARSPIPNSTRMAFASLVVPSSVMAPASITAASDIRS